MRRANTCWAPEGRILLLVFCHKMILSIALLQSQQLFMFKQERFAKVCMKKYPIKELNVLIITAVCQKMIKKTATIYLQTERLWLLLPLFHSEWASINPIYVMLLIMVFQQILKRIIKKLEGLDETD